MKLLMEHFQGILGGGKINEHTNKSFEEMLDENIAAFQRDMEKLTVRIFASQIRANLVFKIQIPGF